MITRFLAVDIKLCFIVNRSEMQDDSALKLRSCNVYGLSVPDSGDEIRIFNSRKLALGAERNNDFFIPFFFFKNTRIKLTVAEIEFKIPLSVEIESILSFSLRIGMFCSWNVH